MNTKRIIAGFIDLLITCIIQGILFSLLFIKPMLEFGYNGNIFDAITGCLIITYCSMSFMIIRDIIGKRSVGKVIMKLEIVNKNDKKESNILRRLLRNITWLFGPLDILVFLITQERIGDKIAKTNVIESTADN